MVRSDEAMVVQLTARGAAVRNATEKSPQLEIATGLPDDQRQVLDAGHPFYVVARHALEWQASWSPEYLRSFWLAHLRDWPRRGRRGHAEQLAEVVDYAHNVLQLTRVEIADLLDVVPDTVRARGTIERADEVMTASPWDVDPDSAKALAVGQAPVAPVVYPTNPAAPAHVIPSITPDDAASHDLGWRPYENLGVLNEKLRRREREMLASGELEQRGALLVRNGDVAAALSAWRRMTEQGGTSPERAAAQVADARAVGDIPLAA